MHDLHCHASFSSDPVTFAQLVQASDLHILSATVMPDDYLRSLGDFADAAHIRVAAGLHPWWVPSDRQTAGRMADRLIAQLETTRFVGEVGLDFSPAHVHSAAAQQACLKRILSACAGQGGKAITLHSVRAADELLDLLAETGCIESCTCILHWFSGSSEELSRAARLGCFFSVGERMLATKRGRAYVRTIPRGRLLLETDLPAQRSAQEVSDLAPKARAHQEFEALYTSLGRALEGVLACGGPHTRKTIEAASAGILD